MDGHFSSEDHGGLNLDELKSFGILPENILDFSVNSNPFGPPPAVINAIRMVDISIYPDRQNNLLKRALADVIKATPQNILIGNGTADLIWLTIKAFSKPGERALILGPTFGEYRRAANALGMSVDEVRASPPNFHPPIELLIRRIENEHPKLVFLCNPNNPTGISLHDDAIEQIITACNEKTILILDEAYRSFVEGDLFSELPQGNCLILRSMTKDFALAGIRLGYALGSPDIIKELSYYQPSWNVNAIAQAAGLAAIREASYYKDTLLMLKELKVSFFAQLSNPNYTLLPSDVHFGIIHLNHPAGEMRQRLLKNYIQVRDCASFGLIQHIRISTRKRKDNLKFIEIFNKIIEDN